MYNLELEILDGIRNLNLLGRRDAVRMGLIARVNVVGTKVYVENVNACEMSRKQILHEYRDVGENIGCMPGEYVIKVDHTVTPVVHPPRSVPVPIRQQVQAELSNLESKGVIAKVYEPTQWVNSGLCEEKKWKG